MIDLDKHIDNYERNIDHLEGGRDDWVANIMKDFIKLLEQIKEERDL